MDEAEIGLVALTHIHMLDILRFLIKSKPLQMCSCLDLILKLICRSIETTHVELRKKCAEYAKTTLKTMLANFDNCGFNMVTQNFIVPNSRNDLVVFDLKMGLEWAVLSMHKKPVTAIGIHHDGNYLASFSLEEGRVIVWEIPDRGFFNSFFSNSDNRVYKEMDIKKYLVDKQVSGSSTGPNWSVRFKEMKEIEVSEKTKNLKFLVKV